MLEGSLKMLDDVKSLNGKKDLLQITTTVTTKACKMIITR